MVFQWSLRDSKSPQVFRILLSILADLTNAVLVTSSSCDFQLFQSPFQTFREHSTNYDWYHRYSHIQHIFSVLWQGLSTCLFVFFDFYCVVIMIIIIIIWFSASFSVSNNPLLELGWGKVVCILCEYIFVTSFGWYFSGILVIIIIIIIYSLRVFHISVSWWSFTGVWVTARLLKSSGLVSVFWLFSIMQ